MAKNLSKQYHYKQLAIIFEHFKTNESPPCDSPFKNAGKLSWLLWLFL